MLHSSCTHIRRPTTCWRRLVCPGFSHRQLPTSTGKNNYISTRIASFQTQLSDPSLSARSYVVGFTLFFISITITMILIVCVHTPPESNRAWRLFSIPWFFCGCTTTFSSFRGYVLGSWNLSHEYQYFSPLQILQSSRGSGELSDTILGTERIFR